MQYRKIKLSKWINHLMHEVHYGGQICKAIFNHADYDVTSEPSWMTSFYSFILCVIHLSDSCPLDVCVQGKNADVHLCLTPNTAIIVV